MEVTVDKTPTSPKLHKAIQGNLQGKSGILSGDCCSRTPNNIKQILSCSYFQVSGSIIDCSQSNKLESEAKLINYFIWCLSHFSSLPCLTMYKYCEEKITLYVSFLGIIVAVFFLDFTLENIETLVKKKKLFSSVPHPKNYYNHVTSLNHQHYYYHDKLFNESRLSYKWDLTTLLNGN